MKKLLTLIFTISFFAAFAQYPYMTVNVSGYVTVEGTNLAVDGHMVKIYTYTTDSTGTSSYDEVYTNPNGYYSYTNTIIGVSGYLIVETLGCFDYMLSQEFEISYNSNNVFTADFQICEENLNCHADFYQYQLEGYTFAFMDNSTPSNCGYTWSFGDGTYSFEQNPMKTYDGPGQYIVSLTISTPDSSCIDSTSQIVIVNEETCKAFFTWYENPVYDLTISFADSSMGAPTMWNWDFGDGATSSEQFPTHSYNEPGFYNVCLTISNEDNTCFSIYCNTVMVGNMPCQAQFTYWSNPYNNPFEVQFEDLSYGNPEAWSWNFGDGTTSNEQYPLHQYNSAGMYQVCLVISGPECQSTWCMDVWVDSTYMNCYNYFTYQTVNNTVAFTGWHYGNGYELDSLNTYYEWDFGDGEIASGNYITHEYQSGGVYYVTLTSIGADGCTAVSAQEILVGDTLFFNQVYGQVFEDNFPLTSGIVLIFSLESGPNYYPYFDMTMVDFNGVYSFPMVPNGDYNILAIPTDGSNYLPTYYEGTLFWQDATIVSAGQTLNPLNIQLVSAQGTMPQGNGSISGHINQSGIRDGFLGQVIIYLTDENHNIIAFTQVNENGDFSFNNLAYGDYFIRAELPGIYSDYIPVTVSATQVNATVNMTVTGNSILGKREGMATASELSVSPNPANNVVRISFTGNNNPVRISVIDLTGRELTGYDVNSSISHKDFNIQHLNPGIYLVKLQFSDSSQKSAKLIVR